MTDTAAGSSAYSAAQGRRFAFTLAIAFGVIASLTFWRDRETIAAVTGGGALLLLVAGLALPSRLEIVERGWMKLAHGLSRITTPIFMGIVYFVVLTPAGLIRRTVGSNPLVHRRTDNSYWVRRTAYDPETKRRRMERQF